MLLVFFIIKHIAVVGLKNIEMDNMTMTPSFRPADQKLVSFENIERKGHVILKPLRSKKAANGQEMNHTTVQFRGFKDGATDTWYGIPIGHNADGTYKFKPIRIDGHHHYNLEIEQDAKEWHIVKNHFSICTNGKPGRNHLFVVEDIEKDAEKKIEKTNKTIKAIEIINQPDMSERRIRDIARLFMIDTINNSYTVIKNLLYEKGLSDPERFLSVMQNEDELDILVIIKRALHTNLIQVTPDKGFMFKNTIPLGATEGAVVNSLRKDKQMLVAIDVESKSLDKFHSEEEKPKADSKSKKVDDK